MTITTLVIVSAMSGLLAAVLGGFAARASYEASMIEALPYWGSDLGSKPGDEIFALQGEVRGMQVALEKSGPLNKQAAARAIWAAIASLVSAASAAAALVISA